MGLGALLPAVARGPLGLGAGGYGLLLGGLGAVRHGAGAASPPPGRDRADGHRGDIRLRGGDGSRRRWSAIVPTVLALAVAGVAGIAVQSTLMATAQVQLPAWTRSRAGLHAAGVQGGQALGAIGWGLLAEHAGLPLAFLIPAAALVAGTTVSVVTLALPEEPPDMTTVRHWPEPASAISPDSDAGPVLVVVEWLVPKENAEAFVEVMRWLGKGPQAHGRDAVGAVPGHRGPVGLRGVVHRGQLARAPAPASRARNGQ